MKNLPGWVPIALIVLISLAWAASLAEQFFNPSYTAPPSINYLFSGIVGVLLWGGGKGGGNGGPTGPNGEKP